MREEAEVIPSRDKSETEPVKSFIPSFTKIIGQPASCKINDTQDSNSMKQQIQEPLLECDYDRNPTELFKYIEAQQFNNALSIFGESKVLSVTQANTWVVRKEPNGEKYRWRILPIHAALIFEAPLKLIKLIISVASASLRCKDDRGQLPLHLAFQKGNDATIVEVMNGYKAGFRIKDNNGKTPIEYDDNLSAKRIETFTKMLGETEQREELNMSIQDDFVSNLSSFINEMQREDSLSEVSKKSIEDEPHDLLKFIESMQDTLQISNKNSSNDFTRGDKESREEMVEMKEKYRLAMKKIKSLESKNEELLSLEKKANKLQTTCDELEMKSAALALERDTSLKTIESLTEENKKVAGTKAGAMEAKTQKLMKTNGEILEKLNALEIEKKTVLEPIIEVLEKKSKEMEVKYKNLEIRRSNEWESSQAKLRDMALKYDELESELESKTLEAVQAKDLRTNSAILIKHHKIALEKNSVLEEENNAIPEMLKELQNLMNKLNASEQKNKEMLEQLSSKEEKLREVSSELKQLKSSSMELIRRHKSKDEEMRKVSGELKELKSRSMELIRHHNVALGKISNFEKIEEEKNLTISSLKEKVISQKSTFANTMAAIKEDNETKVAKLNDSEAALKQVISATNTALAEEKEAVSWLKKDIEQLNEKLLSKEEQYEAESKLLDNERKSLKESVQQLESKLRIKENEYANSLEKIFVLEEREKLIPDMQECIEKLKINLKNESDENSRLLEENEELKKDIVLKGLEIAKEQDTIRDLEAEKSKLHEKIEELEKGIETFKTKHNAMKKEFINFGQVNEEIMLSSQDDIGKLNELLIAKEQEVMDAAEKILQLEKINSSKATLQKNFENISEKLANLEEEHDATLQELSALEKDYETLEEENKKLPMLLKTNKDLNEKLSFWKMKCDETSSALSEAKKCNERDNEVLTEKLQSVNEELTITKKKYNVMVETCASLEESSENLETALEDIKQRLHDKEIECSDSSDSLVNLSRANNSLRQTLERLTKNHSHVLKTFEEFKIKFNSNDEELARVNSENADLLEKQVHLETHIENQHKMLLTAKSCLTKMRSTVKKQKKDIADYAARRARMESFLVAEKADVNENEESADISKHGEEDCSVVLEELNGMVKDKTQG